MYLKVLENFNQFSQVWKNVIIKRADLILNTSKKLKPLNSISLHCTL